MSTFLRLTALAAAFVGIGLVAAVLQADPSPRESMLSKLGSNNPDVRKSEISRLEDSGASALSGLLDELEGDHTTITKASIVEAVRRIGVSSGNAGALKSMLKSTDPATRSGAIAILATKPSLARAELLEVARNADESPAIRGCAAVAAGQAGPQARAELLALLRDPAMILSRDSRRISFTCGARRATELPPLRTTTMT